MERDSLAGTLTVATVLCVTCSVLVASAAVILKPYQEKNEALDRQKNILIAAGLFDPKDPEDAQGGSDLISQRFKESVETQWIEIDSGKVVDEEDTDPKAQEPVDKTANDPGMQTRPKYTAVYRVVEGDKVKKYVFPIFGKGLWSTIYGFIAVEGDLNTVAGITFYKDGETPGLGGEINSAYFKQQWPGKKIYNDEDEVAIRVTKKGNANLSSPYDIDGLSGATITSRGVSNFVRYWLSEQGFGPYLDAQTSTSTADASQVRPLLSENP